MDSRIENGLKNNLTGNGAVIGTGPIISGWIGPDCIIPGTPAGVLRAGVEQVYELA